LRRQNLDHSDKGRLEQEREVGFTLIVMDEVRFSEIQEFIIVTERREQREE
jgi:hypothetical protein